MTYTMDRVEQVNWIRELAGNIVSLTPLGAGTAEEVVDYFLSGEGQESWEIELPDWFDDHDRRLLVDAVDASL